MLGEQGARFLDRPLPGTSASALGYADGSAADVPGQLLALLPTGPVLSPTVALAEGSP